MNLQEQYWDRKIKEWTQNSYQNKFQGLNLIERAANLFRGPITKRMTTALNIVGPRAKDKVILDLGCGLGDFCFAILKYRPKQVIGVDISGVAIKLARQGAQKRKVWKKVKFVHASAVQMKKLPSFDIAIGLGFIDYLKKEELKRLFKLLADKQFMFSYFEKKLSWRNCLHQMYLKLNQCPGAYKYTREELQSLAFLLVKIKFLEKDGLLFITNLPKNEKKII